MKTDEAYALIIGGEYDNAAAVLQRLAVRAGLEECGIGYRREWTLPQLVALHVIAQRDRGANRHAARAAADAVHRWQRNTGPRPRWLTWNAHGWAVAWATTAETASVARHAAKHSTHLVHYLDLEPFIDRAMEMSNA